MTPLLAISLLVAGAVGTLAAVQRDPGRQAAIQGIYGLLLAIAFVLLRAPDVALSQLAVGALAVPLLALTTLARLRK